MMKPYAGLSGIYDFWQEDNDASKWADFAERLIGRFCRIQKGDGPDGRLIVADLGCGTGSVAIEMASRGYDVIGIDESHEMLSVAASKNTDAGVCFICQDITRMELFGTVDVMLCFLDTVNHITDPRRLNAFFGMCKRYLNIGGVLIFDIATEHYFRDIRGNRTFAETGDSQAVLWNNTYNSSKGISTAFVTAFTADNSGLYLRADTMIKEKVYREAQIEELAISNGFTPVKICADFTSTRPGPSAERIFFVMENRYDRQKADLKDRKRS
ncbi:MAG: class I SAM-dependent methyltransferase [Saccharofermentanales bacterium]